jgi:putative phosphoribosyl transferase
VRKLGTPGHEELGMGAIGEGDVRVLNDDIVASVGASPAQLTAVEEAERAELERRAQRFRGDRPRLDLSGKTAIVVDDGIATGSTAIAALQVARAQGAARTVLATPVAPHGIEGRVTPYADEFVALDTPRWFSAVGQFYDDFDQTTDNEVIACLQGRR